MEKTYEIKHEPAQLADGSIKEKWNIYYYNDEEEITKEFHSYDGVTTDHVIKSEYKLKTK